MKKIILIISALYLSSCTKTIKYPQYYVAIPCQERSECVVVGSNKVIKKTMLKLKTKQVRARLKGVMVYLQEDSVKNIQQLLKYHPGKELLHFQGENLISRVQITSASSPSQFYYSTASEKESIKLCEALSSLCIKKDIARDRNQERNTKIARNKFKEQSQKHPKFMTSYQWLSAEEQLTLYKDDLKTIKKKINNAYDYTFIQAFENDKFVYDKNMIKLTIGWVSRAEIYPTNLGLAPIDYKRRIIGLTKNLKCAAAENRQYLMAMTESLKLAFFNHFSKDDWKIVKEDLDKKLKQHLCK